MADCIKYETEDLNGNLVVIGIANAMIQIQNKGNNKSLIMGADYIKMFDPDQEKTLTITVNGVIEE